MILWFFLNVVAITVMVRLLTGDSDVGIVKPLVLSIGAVAMLAATQNVMGGSVSMAFSLIMGALIVALFVAVCCWLWLEVPFRKSALIGGLFVVFNTLLILLWLLPVL